MFNFSETPITLFLLLINVMVSLYALYMDQGLLDRLSFKPYQILKEKAYYRMITGAFVHVGMGHLAFNMITLYFFGPYLELLLGPTRFLLIYLGSLLAAHGLALFMHREDPNYSAVGASGAISGIVFAYCLFNPFSQIGLFFAIWIPAWLFAIGYVALSIYAMKQAQASGQRGGIAHEAHLGGAVGGILFTILLEPRALQIFLGQLGL